MKLKQPQTVWEVEILLDFIIKKGWDIPKTIVDCGAGRPEHCSNSKKFIQEYGFDAVLIDALESNISACRKYYENIDNVYCQQAILSDKEEDVYFEENKCHWSLSGIKEGKPNATTSKLSKIIDDFGLFEVGVMSIDLEGQETPVLRDLISNSIFPSILIVEANTLGLMKEHRDLLSPHYKLLFGVLPNQVFYSKELENNSRFTKDDCS